jgi:putative transposase
VEAPRAVGGGLIRSLGGWFEVTALRRLDIHEAADDRILGSGDFVQRIIKEADDNLRRHFPVWAEERK